jgi:ABC-type nitrate/sulfonate/bicarbonate transport system substrate-binding protein
MEDRPNDMKPRGSAPLRTDVFGPVLSSRMNRRTFLARLGLTGAGLACGAIPSVAPGQADDAPLGRIAYQLGWIKNFQYAGDYIADYRGYFRKFGLDVDLLAGGPNMTADPVVVSGKALIGQSEPDFMASAINHGAAIKCVGTCYQRNTAAILSLASSPLVTPQDMIGRKIGLQSGNEVVWRAFLKLNKIDPSRIQTVPVQFDFTPLVTGEVDGFYGEVVDDAVQLKAKGHDVRPLVLADFGYKMFSGTFTVATDSLTDKAKRAQLVAFLKGDILGWQDEVRDPDFAGKLTAEVYGKGNGLDAASQSESCRVQNDFIVSADTQKHGIYWMTPELIEETIATLAASGVKATPDMFTNELLEEVYAGKASL